ncbi:hypothetical protein HG530_006802 [Fusarium avenaceum]|nr:hypothetical protein HG530_006802 [Fusarium avenaceum]
MLLVLAELELDPLTFRVAMAVESDKVLGGEFLLSAGVEPSRRLWEEHGTESNDAGEHELKANRDHPRGVCSLVLESSTRSTASNKGTDRPHDIVEAGDDTTVSRVRDLDDEETTGHKLINAGSLDASNLDNDADDDDPGANGHTSTATPSINGRSNTRNGDNGTDLVHGSDDT